MFATPFTRRDYLYLAAIGIWLLFAYGLFAWNFPITDTVESNYALSAVNMLQHQSYLSPMIYDQYWYDKPIFTYWLLMTSFSLFGISDFAARLPFILCAALNGMFMYYGMRLIAKRRDLALWCAIMLGTSLEFWYISHAILTDGYLFLFTQGILYFAYLGLRGRHVTRHMMLAYASAGLAVLTKGPVGLILPGLILIAYVALFQRDTLTWQRLFHPLGLLAFALVALPWYILMYSYHGMAFIEEFLGLHNVVRATIPEHPEQNWWFMYFVLWPVSLLPWTGLTIYELIYGERNSWFKYLLTWGLGVFIFYNLMATKYITYTFLCIIPFIILTSQGYIRLKGHLLRNIPPREVKVIAMAPDSDFCWLPQQTKSYSKNLLVLLPAFLLVAIAIIGVWLGSRTQPDVDSSQLSIALSIGAVLCVLPLLYALIRPHICRSIKAVAISTSILYVLLLCALPPIVDDASTEKLADTLALRPTTQMYYYRDYRTSLVYYTGHSVTQIIPDPDAETIWDKGKNVMPVLSEADTEKAIQGQRDYFIFVPKKYKDDFLKTSLSQHTTEFYQVENIIVFKPKAQ